jgi:hypothetical protein
MSFAVSRENTFKESRRFGNDAVLWIAMLRQLHIDGTEGIKLQVK